MRNQLKSYYCFSFPVSLGDKDSASNIAFMYPRFFYASINYSLNSKKQRNTGSVFSAQVYGNYFAKGAVALLSIRPIVCRWSIMFLFAKYFFHLYVQLLLLSVGNVGGDQGQNAHIN